MRIRLFSATVALVLAAGCVQYGPIPGTESSDSDTRATDPITFASPNMPQAVARCIVRNIDDRYFTMTAKVEVPNNHEVLEVRARSEVGIAAIIEIRDRIPSGSDVAVRLSNHYLQRERLARSMVAGC